MADQVGPRRLELIVFAPKGHNLRGRPLPGQPDKPVRMQAAAIDHKVCGELARRRLDPPTAILAHQAGHASVDCHPSAETDNLRRQRIRHRTVLDDALLRNVDGCDSGGVRFNSMDFLSPEFPQTAQSILVTARPQRFQPRRLVGIRGDDNLAADFVRDAVLSAKFHQLPEPLHAEPGFFRLRLVVESGMKHTAVMGGLL